MPELPFQGALKIRDINTYIPNTDVLIETTGPPNGQPELYPDNINQNPCHQDNLPDSDLSTTTLFMKKIDKKIE